MAQHSAALARRQGKKTRDWCLRAPDELDDAVNAFVARSKVQKSEFLRRAAAHFLRVVEGLPDDAELPEPGTPAQMSLFQRGWRT